MPRRPRPVAGSLLVRCDSGLRRAELVGAAVRAGDLDLAGGLVERRRPAAFVDEPVMVSAQQDQSSNLGCAVLPPPDRARKIAPTSRAARLPGHLPVTRSSRWASRVVWLSPKWHAAASTGMGCPYGCLCSCFRETGTSSNTSTTEGWP